MRGPPRSRSPRPPQFASPRAGYISAIEAELIGQASSSIGAGRDTKEDTIDPAVGVILEVKVGEKVDAGSVLCRLYYTREDRVEEAAESLRRRFLRVPRGESRRATAGAYLWADLLGARVETPEGTWLGIVRELVRAGENDVLVIADASGRERLLPMLESVVKVVDVAAGRIVAIPQEEAG